MFLLCSSPFSRSSLPQGGPFPSLAFRSFSHLGAGSDPAGCHVGCSPCLTSCSGGAALPGLQQPWAQPPAPCVPNAQVHPVHSTSCPWLTLGAATHCLSHPPRTAAVQCVEAFLQCTLTAAQLVQLADSALDGSGARGKSAGTILPHKPNAMLWI